MTSMSDHDTAGVGVADAPLPTLDLICAAAIELAAEAAREVAEEPGHVGGHLDVAPTDELSVVHRFACAHPGYPGWTWSVGVSRNADSEVPTVNEVWLEPGAGALLAPPWRPWSERVQPGDLGAGDVFPTDADDPRLTAGFTGDDDLDSVVANQPLHPLQWQLGLGRARVLSASGREDAAERWISGDGGPDSPVARAAADRCVTCGWLLPIGGPLGQEFGVCAQPMSPSDGRVVALLHGCGAHSEVAAEPAPTDVVGVVLDEVGYDDLIVESREAVDEVVIIEAEADQSEAAVEADVVQADVVKADVVGADGELAEAADGDAVASPVSEIDASVQESAVEGSVPDDEPLAAAESDDSADR